MFTQLFMIVLCPAAAMFYGRFLNEPQCLLTGCKRDLATSLRWHRVVVLLALCSGVSAHTQAAEEKQANPPPPETAQQLQERLAALESEVSELKAIVKQLQGRDTASSVRTADSAVSAVAQTPSGVDAPQLPFDGCQLFECASR